MDQYTIDLYKKIRAKGIEPTPELFAQTNFRYFFVNVLGYRWEKHFDEWQWLIENNKRFLLQCARGHGKTVFLTAYCVWLVYRALPVEILFFSHSEEQVKLNIMNKIDEIVMKNDRLSHLRPSSKQLWGSQLKTFSTGAIIRGESFGSSTRGAHPDYIFEDDPLKDKGGMSPEEQHNYHMTVISGMAKRTTTIGVIGTPLDNGDLLEQLEKNPAYCFRAYPALDDAGEPLFPHLFTKEDLAAKELEIGSFAFSREFLLKRIDSKSQVFKDQYRTINDSYLFEDLKVVRTLIDPAISQKEAACDSAVVTCGVDSKNHLWEMDTQLLHSDDSKKLLDYIVKIASINCNKYQDYAIVIEAEVFQKVLAYDLRQLLLEKHLDVRVIEVSHQGNQGKHERIAGLQTKWETRAIHLLPDSPLISQARYYRPNIKGFKLDALDALSWIRAEDVSVPITEAPLIDPGCEDAWEI